MSRWLIIAGAVLLVVGLVLHYASGLLSSFGKLPGDIRIESDARAALLPDYLDGDRQPRAERVGR